MSGIIRPTTGVLLLLSLILSLGSVGCSPRIKAEIFSCSDLNDKINVHKVREDDFSKYGFDKQYAIYICGMQSIHPPAMNLAILFAKQGSKVVGLMKTKLLEAKDDLTIRDLVLVFNYMGRLKTYDVANDDELMHIISLRVKGMKDPAWRETAEEMVAEIRR